MYRIKKSYICYLCLIAVVLASYLWLHHKQESQKELELTATKAIDSHSLGMVNSKKEAIPPQVDLADEQIIESATTDKTAKKQYEDDWCIAKEELNERDYLYAKQEIYDWDIAQGKMGIKGPNVDYPNKVLSPNHILIESYEALPLKELKSLVEQGDKWAMITFVQKFSANRQEKIDVAKQLLVQGGAYYALDALVIESIVQAKTLYRKTQSPQKSIEPIIDALVYTYWGLENYHTSGLIAYTSIITTPPFSEELYALDAQINAAESQISAKYKKLNNWVIEERAKQGIQVPQPSKAAIRHVAELIAVNQKIDPKVMTTLASLKITAFNPITDTPCVKEYQDYFNVKLND